MTLRESVRAGVRMAVHGTLFVEDEEANAIWMDGETGQIWEGDDVEDECLKTWLAFEAWVLAQEREEATSP